MKRAFFVRTGIALVMAASAVAACSGDKAPRRGQIMVALQTDMSIPQGVTKIFLQVSVRGEVKHSETYVVDPLTGTAKLPATLAIVAGEEVAPPVQVLVVGLKGNEAKTLSKVVTTIPRDRIATLRVPIQWLCEGTARPIPGGIDAYESTCPVMNGVETSCVAGACVDVNIPEPMLPTYSPADVFGGGQGPQDFLGQCFDVPGCFRGSVDVVPDAQCRVTVPQPPGTQLNVAVRLPPEGSGICDPQNPNACFVALDNDPLFGWYEVTEGGGEGSGDRGGSTGAPQLDGGTNGPGPGAPGEGGDDVPPPDPGGGMGSRFRTQQSPEGTTKTIQLPPVVCDKIDDGLALGVSVSTSCVTKTTKYPTCGPWSSVDGSPIGGGGGGPQNDGGIGADCPQFPENPGSISSDPLATRYFEAAAEIVTQIEALRSLELQACSNIVVALGGSVPPAGNPPSDAELTTVCDAARTAMANAGVEDPESILITPSFCTVPHEEQLTCEQNCSGTRACESAPFEARCPQSAGTCEGSCYGDCVGTRDQPVTCNGTCEGVCTGTCEGTCLSPDGSDTGDCAGWCNGICVGDCEGTCTFGGTECEGFCVSLDETDNHCEGTLIDPVCSFPLAVDECSEPTCAALCAAETELAAQCSLTYAQHYGVATPEYKNAVDMNFGPLFDISDKAFRLASITSHVAQVGTLLTTQGSDLQCASAALLALSTATTTLSTLVLNAESVLTFTDLTPDGGTTPGGICTSSGDTPCTECIKAACCPQYLECNGDSSCQLELSCMITCVNGGDTPAYCSPLCGVDGTIGAAANGLFTCAQQGCNPSCFGSGAGGGPDAGDPNPPECPSEAPPQDSPLSCFPTGTRCHYETAICTCEDDGWYCQPYTQ